MRASIQFVATALLIFVAACSVRRDVSSGNGAEAERPSRAVVGNKCSAMPKESTTLTAAERCELALVAARCNASDACVADCLANERHRTRIPGGLTSATMGGCEEICFLGADVYWDPPVGYLHCSAAFPDVGDW